MSSGYEYIFPLVETELWYVLCEKCVWAIWHHRRKWHVEVWIRSPKFQVVQYLCYHIHHIPNNVADFNNFNNASEEDDNLCGRNTNILNIPIALVADELSNHVFLGTSPRIIHDVRFA